MDTIAAIATPVGQSAIGIIKLSGPAAIDITQKIYISNKGNKRLTSAHTHTIHYGHIINPLSKKKIDEVLVSIMRKPHSYTREDVVEINCHGGKWCLYKVLELVLQQGARIAQPGEFTKRAFLNGRIDLTQAEAVIDIINVQSERGLSLLLDTLEGKTFKQLYSFHQEIIQWQTLIENEINFSDQSSLTYSVKKLAIDITRWMKTINSYIANYKQSSLLINGLQIAIVGQTNVGKSSIMNRLLKKKRSIVTNIPGTTTDIIEDSFSYDGIIIRLLDTAGFSQSPNTIEQEGIQLTRQIIGQADINMVVCDGSQNFNHDDQAILDLVCSLKRPFFIVCNKMDLGDRVSAKLFAPYRKLNIPLLKVSAYSGKGFNQIQQVISTLCIQNQKESFSVSLNLRQKQILLNIKNVCMDLNRLIKKGQPEELLAESFRWLDKLCNQFFGQHASEDILDQIFSQFCVGK